jgi:hypothetical protein
MLANVRCDRARSRPWRAPFLPTPNHGSTSCGRDPFEYPDQRGGVSRKEPRARTRDSGRLAPREPSNEETEHESGLRSEWDIRGHADDDAERQAQYGPKPNGGSGTHMRESMPDASREPCASRAGQ